MEVGALVDETLALGVDVDAERIIMLLETVADRQVAERRGVHVPFRGMRSGPMAGRHGADLERHVDALAGVELRAPDLRQVPVGTEITRPRHCA